MRLNGVPSKCHQIAAFDFDFTSLPSPGALSPFVYQLPKKFGKSGELELELPAIDGLSRASFTAL